MIIDLQINLDRFARLRETIKYTYKYFFNAGTLNYGHFSFTIPPARMAKLIKMGGEHSVIKMLLRYASILEGSQHWHVPEEVYRKIDVLHHIDIEGFASPINSQMVLLRDEPKFCSIFADTDSIFGSQGSFFNYDFIGKTATAFTPYVPDLLEKIRDKLLATFENARGAKTTIFVGLPAWYDAKYVKDLLESKWTKKISKYGPGKSYFRDREDKKIQAYFANAWIVMSTETADWEFMDTLFDD